VHRSFASFSYQAQSWNKPRRVVAKVEWYPGELYPRVGFIVTNLARPAERVVAFYNQRGTCEQFIKEGKGAVKWTRLSCRTFAANAVRLQLHVLAYNLGNFMRTLALPKTAEPWSLISLREKLIKIGAKVVSHGRYVTFQLAESRGVAADVHRGPLADRSAAGTARPGTRGAGVKFDRRQRQRCALMQAKQGLSAPRRTELTVSTACCARRARFPIARDARKDNPCPATIGDPANVGPMS
jgi:hypothetical protein